MWEAVDERRRALGRLLDAAGLGPQETPFAILDAWPGARLRTYAPGADGPALLILPAPFKRGWLFDLLPQVSVVRAALARGFAVHLLEWTDPGPAEEMLGLADFAATLPLRALDVIAAATGDEAPVLVGHSLGGTFAAILASLHPARVGALVLVDAPLAFGADGGPLAASVARLGTGAQLRARFGSASGKTVPGSLIGMLSVMAVPEEFHVGRHLDRAASLLDPAALAIHIRCERWALDELALPGRLFEEVVDGLYREDRFRAGTLAIGEARAGLGALAARGYAVVTDFGRVVPRSCVLAGLDVAPRARLEVLEHRCETGTLIAHLGPVVGRRAHRELWPRILDGVARRSRPALRKRPT